MFGSLIRNMSSLKQRIPLLNQIHINFIFLHYIYIISWVIIGAVIVYGERNVSFIDALFQAAGAATQSGLNTVNLNNLKLYQQIVLYFVTMFCTPIFIHSAVVFIRLYWFEKRFQNVVRDARALRSTRSRMDTVTGDKHSDEMHRAELGVGGRPIVVLRNNSGDARESRKPSPSPFVRNEESHSEGESPGRKPDSDQTSSDDTDQGLERRFGLGSLRVPTQLNPEDHIRFVENQRKNKGALRIPSPREYDRGGVPEALGDEDNDGDNDTLQPMSPTFPNAPSELDNIGPLEGPHITINEPDHFPRTRTRQSTFPRIETRPTFQSAATKDVNDTDNAGMDPITTRNTFRGILRSMTQERTALSQPYLSWNATVARNSNFVDLTEEQRDELGGIEYRALKTLAVVLISYYVGFHLLGLVCMVGWIMGEPRWGDVVKADGVGRPWWGIFTAASAFNDLGFTLTPDGMMSFQYAVFPLLLFSFLIIIGNTAFPCMLRFMIWTLSKLTRRGTALWEELKFLLDHPRRCFTLLFPRNATWWLTAILFALNGIDLIFFIILDLNDSTVTALPPGIRVLCGFFQAASTRTAGFSVVNLSDLHPAIQVSYLVMMYISVFPIAISVRRTNVYEEKSLGIYEDDQEVDSNHPSYISAHLRRQLSFDLWYVFLGLFVIAIAEGGRLQAASDYSFQLFTVLFEVVSAYGTVGLSFGYPGVDTSFSGQFNVVSKLVIIAMQIRGRHRGLPYALDRAVLLPSDALNRRETADMERRIRRRASNLSGVETVGPTPSIGRPPSRSASQAQTDSNGISTGLETRDWHFQPATNGDSIVQRSGTLHSDY